MTTNDTYLAVFLGSKTSPRMKAWMALPEAERRAKEKEGMAAWKTWVEKHQAAVSVMGGPLGTGGPLTVADPQRMMATAKATVSPTHICSSSTSKACPGW